MASTLYRAAAFALYQTSLVVGILLLPMALLMRQVGITLPVHRIVSRASAVYERADSNAA